MSLEILGNIDHFVLVMLENRSFDHILGNLYPGGRGPRDQPFEGLTGKEQNPLKGGNPIRVYELDPDDPYCYFTPRADPGEGFSNTSSQLYGDQMIVQQKDAPTNAGFVNNYQYTIGWDEKKGYKVYEGVSAKGIMAMHTPKTLPVLSTLAQQYAVCDHWFCSVPSETQCNRAFVHMATSEGLIHNNWKYQFKSKSIFGALGDKGHTWRIYAYNADQKSMSMTRFDIADLESAPKENFGAFKDFKEAASAGQLAAYSFLEPNWGPGGNSMHPNHNVANGEQWLAEIYHALRKSPQWNRTMLIITFDEHGGCYDHVAPPANAVPPDDHKPPNGFSFDRFGVRVPCVIVSPLIEAGTVHRAYGPTPFDHTSILRTIELRFGLHPLTRRDAAAPHIAGLLTLSEPRLDDALAGVTPPTARTPPVRGIPAQKTPPSALQKGLAHQAHRYPDPAEEGHSEALPDFDDGDHAVRWAHERYSRYRKWKYGD